jgi:hypothetical protein
MYIICVVFQVMGMCVDLRWPYVNVDELVVNDDELMWGRGFFSLAGAGTGKKVSL